MEHLLHEPLAVGPMTLANRFVLPAMHLNYTMDGTVTNRLIAFYRARAMGGTGLIILGGCLVDPLGGGFFLVGLHEDRFIPGLTRFTSEVRAGNDTKLCAQLYHAGRYAHSWYLQNQPVAPSAVPSRYNPETPREMTEADIEHAIAAFAAAARRAKAAGFDAVEVLASAGYLISQFLSPVANLRDDAWGGAFANRARFGCEVVRAVRAAVGPDTAVLVRIAGSDFVPGSHTNAESVEAAAMFVDAGADAINVTGGWHESRVPQITMSVPEGAYVYLAAAVKRRVSVPVIASNRLGDPALAAQVLANGDADLIAMGRPLIADPDLPRKVKDEQFAEIRPCIACNQGCFDAVFNGRAVECMVNPRAGYELKRTLDRAEVSKRVVVIGGGPGGVEAAIVAAERGHRVTLFDRNAFVGGALYYAAAAPGRQDFYRLAHFLEAELERTGVRVRLGVEADVDAVRALRPDVVIVAAGARPIIPEWVARAPHPNLIVAEDLLGGRAVVLGDVVVIGGGSVGAEVALQVVHRDTISPEVAAFLLVNEAEPPERVRELLLTPRRAVHVCDVLPKIAKDMGKSTRWTVLQELRRSNVTLHTQTRVSEITATGVVLTAEDGTSAELACGTVVVALGYEPNAELGAALTAAGLTVQVIGDAKAPRKVMEAIREGFLTAATL